MVIKFIKLFCYRSVFSLIYYNRMYIYWIAYKVYKKLKQKLKKFEIALNMAKQLKVWFFLLI